MKVIILSILAIALSFCGDTIAQPFQIEESVPFPEPEKGLLKIMLLANGNTALLHFADNDINYQLYGRDKKIILRRQIHPKILKGTYASIVSVFSVGSDIVLFCSTIKWRTPVLNRAIIDANSGEIRKEEEIGRLEDGFNLDHLDGPANFYIRNDKNSGCYAVGLFNSQEINPDKRLEIRHYNNKHEVINQAFYVSQNKGFKYRNVVDLIVLGGEKVLVCGYVSNTKNEKAGHLSLAQLQAGSTVMQARPLDFTTDLRIEYGVLRQVPGTDHVVLLGLAKTDADRSRIFYSSFLSLLDTRTLALEYNKDVDITNLREEYKKIFGPDGAYNGIPVDLYVNDDGSWSIVLEEITTASSNHASITELGSTGVIVLDKNAREIQNYMIPKIHTLRMAVYEPMYMSKRSQRPKELYLGSQYKSFAYVNSSGKKYILFNDLAENLENLKKGKINNVGSVSDTDAFAFALNDGTADRQLMFGQLEKDCHTIGMFGVSDYDPASGTYVTLKLDNCKGKKVQVIWVNFNP